MSLVISQKRRADTDDEFGHAQDRIPRRKVESSALSAPKHGGAVQGAAAAGVGDRRGSPPAVSRSPESAPHPPGASQAAAGESPGSSPTTPPGLSAGPLAAPAAWATEALQHAERPEPPPCCDEERRAAEATWSRVRSFVEAASRSPLLHSALASLEAGGTHPSVSADADRHGMHWSLAGMLGLFLRAGYTAASEELLLALLWTLESWGNVWRSSASTVLHDYILFLACFDKERVVSMANAWPESFHVVRKGMCLQQMDLLKRLDWRIRLDLSAEVLPCRHLLFGLAEGSGAPAWRASGGAWAPAGAALCAAVVGGPACRSRFDCRMGSVLRMRRAVSVVCRTARLGPWVDPAMDPDRPPGLPAANTPGTPVAAGRRRVLVLPPSEALSEALRHRRPARAQESSCSCAGPRRAE